jgi:hypothetical protein
LTRRADASRGPAYPAGVRVCGAAAPTRPPPPAGHANRVRAARPGACARVGVLPLPPAAWRRTVAATVSAAIPSARATPCTSLRRAGAAGRARRARACRAGRARAAGRLIAGAAWHAASNGGGGKLRDSRRAVVRPIVVLPLPPARSTEARRRHAAAIPGARARVRPPPTRSSRGDCTRSVSGRTGGATHARPSRWGRGDTVT